MPRLTKPTAQHSAPAGFTRYAAAAALLLGCADDHYLGDLVDQHPGDYQGAGGTAGDQDFAAAPLLGEPEVHIALQHQFPYPVSARIGVGDVDGDGFDDFAIPEESVPGTAYIHLRYGGRRPSDRKEALDLAEDGPRLLLEDPVFSVFVKIVPAGDVDADGYDDFLVGPYACDGADEQVLHLVYGGPRLEGSMYLSDVGVRFVNSRVVPGMSYRCANDPHDVRFDALSDFDGDGFDDFIISDPRWYGIADYPEPGPVFDSVAYVFYGRAERWASGSLSDADARLHAPGSLGITALGDANGDGLSDLILGARASGPKPPEFHYMEDPGGFHWLPGRAQRMSGDIDVASAGTPISLSSRPLAAGDVDGDGITDAILYDDAHAAHLFYGEPGLFDAGVELTLADAIFASPVERFELSAAGDLDGDGDDELVARHRSSRDGRPASHLAVLSGSASRMSGVVEIARFTHPLEWPERDVREVFAAGDLDADGAGDIVTWSSVIRNDDFQLLVEPVMLHIHYGIPGGVLAVPH